MTKKARKINFFPTAQKNVTTPVQPVSTQPQAISQTSGYNAGFIITKLILHKFIAPRNPVFPIVSADTGPGAGQFLDCSIAVYILVLSQRSILIL